MPHNAPCKRGVSGGGLYAKTSEWGNWRCKQRKIFRVSDTIQYRYSNIEFLREKYHEKGKESHQLYLAFGQ